MSDAREIKDWHTITIDVPASYWMSANQRLHWAQKSKRTKFVRTLAMAAARQARVPQLSTTQVAVFIGYPRNGKTDPANASPTIKAAIDGFTDAGVWPDDDSTHVLGPTPLRDPKPDRSGVYRLRFVLVEQEVPW